MRKGPQVERERFDDLEAALIALEHRAAEIRDAGPLEPRKMFREFEAAKQVAGRVEISTGGLIRRGTDAGIDVMGDGAFVAFKGGLRRAELDPALDPIDAVRQALA